MRLLVLYEELAGYFVSVLHHFMVKKHAHIMIIRKEVNKEAPFVFDLSGMIDVQRHEHTTEVLWQKIRAFKPDAVYSGGWATPFYLQVVKHYHGKIPTVLAFDNKWEGSARQRIATLILPLTVTRYFSGCFVAGLPQKKYARKLGFKEKQIREGMYCCDEPLFNGYYKSFHPNKKKAFPHRFLYVGRYIHHKGIHDLWDAFESLSSDERSGWQLDCIGTGDVEPRNVPGVIHHGFKQPEELKQYIEHAGVFILPSHFEPWGVVVQEMACSGLPMLCSREVGAATRFLKEGVNGFFFPASDVKAIREAMLKMIRKTDEQLVAMAEASASEGSSLTHDDWVDRLSELLQG